MGKFEKHHTKITLPRLSNLDDQTITMEVGGDALVFTVPTTEGRHLTVDLRRYRDGDLDHGLMGSAELIRSLLPHIRAHLGHGMRSTRGVMSWVVRVLPPLFHFVTHLQRLTGNAPKSAAEFQNIDGELFKTFLIQQGGSMIDRRKSYSAVYTLLNRVRSTDAPQLYWPTFIIAAKRGPHVDVDPRAVKAVYGACKRILEEAEKHQNVIGQWLTEGRDPRCIPHTETTQSPRRQGGIRNSHWYCKANLAVLMRDYIRSRVLRQDEFDQKTRAKLHRHNEAQGKLFAGITFRELVNALAPSAVEVTAGVLIVSMETGWIDTVQAIDLTGEWYALRRGECLDNLQKTDSVVLFATRTKTSKPHIAIGLAGPRFRSFQIIKRLESRSSLLRDCLREARRQAEALEDRAKRKKDVAEIDILLKSPWLFFNRNDRGHAAVGVFKSNSIEKDLSIIRSRAISGLSTADRNDIELVDSIKRLRWSDLRDAFAAHIYAASGNNMFLLKKALNHSSLSVSRQYVRQRQQINSRFEAFRRIMEAALSEVNSGRSIDPTILFLSSNYTDFREEDRAKLQAYRTRMGMGCRNPRAPDPQLSPGRPHGALCAVQRCVLCSQGIVLRDAYEGLADRHADLIWLRKHSTPARWLTSTFSWEIEALELVRDKIFQTRRREFDQRSSERVAAIARGEAYVFDEPEVAGVYL